MIDTHGLLCFNKIVFCEILPKWLIANDVMLCDRKLLFSEESSSFQDHLQNYEHFMYDLNAEVTEK